MFTIVQGIRMHRRLLITALLAGLAFAHPLGNFSVSRYSKLEMTATGARILYVLDLAEIPSFELLQKWGVKPGQCDRGGERACGGRGEAMDGEFVREDRWSPSAVEA